MAAKKLFTQIFIYFSKPLRLLYSLRVLGTNSLFMSLPVAMDSISKTRAARRTQFVAV